VASEVALARRDSPARGGRHLGLAKALVHEMPHTLSALECGALSEWRATLIVRESACLDAEHRRTLDAELCGDVFKLDGMGDARVAAAAKEIACRLDVAAVVDRSAKAAADRAVTIRPAPDTMAYVTPLLPVAQGVGVYAALKRAADTTFDDRSRGQVMADTLVERVTGRGAEVAEPVAVNLVMSDQTLLGADDSPAVVEEYGPIPAAVARGLISGAVTDERSKATLRRLYRAPKRGRWWPWSRGRDSFRAGWPRSLGCVIKGAAHRIATRRSGIVITRSRETGVGRPAPRMAWALASGATTSRKRRAGRLRRRMKTVYTPPNSSHPTGAHHRSTAPPLPGPPVIAISEVELRIGIAIADLHAA
jgi:hypothetical protein